MLSTVLGDIWMPSTEELTMLGPLWSLVGTIVAVLIAALAVGRNWRVSGWIALIGGLTTILLCVRGAGRLGDGSWSGLAPPDGNAAGWAGGGAAAFSRLASGRAQAVTTRAMAIAPTPARAALPCTPWRIQQRGRPRRSAVIVR